MHIERVEEFAIASQVFAQVQGLLPIAFPDYPSERPYFKLRPHFRYLAWDDETLVGQMGVDHRVIRVGTALLSIFGVIDLCVAPRYQHRSLATQMLELLAVLAHETKRAARLAYNKDDDMRITGGRHPFQNEWKVAFDDDAARDAFEAPILETYEREGSPYFATARLWDDGVIDPLETRRVLGLGIEAALHAPIPETRFGVFRM
jgi:GNAT superfamily N-acetyltransferase